MSLRRRRMFSPQGPPCEPGRRRRGSGTRGANRGRACRPRTGRRPRKAGPIQAYAKSATPYYGVQALVRLWDTAVYKEPRYAAINTQVHARETTDRRLLHDCIRPSLNSREFFLQKAIGWALRPAAAGPAPLLSRRILRTERTVTPAPQKRYQALNPHSRGRPKVPDEKPRPLVGSIPNIRYSLSVRLVPNSRSPRLSPAFCQVIDALSSP